MTYVIDLHLHSPYARATSKQLTFENSARWAKLKGIDLLATGDFTHPAWFDEIKARLRDTGDGLFEHGGVKFILGTEVNCITEQGGRNRRVHMLAFAPSFEVVERINGALAQYGKLYADGRPTLHMSPSDLVEMLLEIDHRCFVIAAHLWTPWFGLYGSKSGFDSLDEAFGDMAGHVTAIETGLSSDPSMNWRVPSLDDVAIMSFSDAHSLPNMGRELTVMNGEMTYTDLAWSIGKQDIAFTTEFFPHEGKYHHSGHRKCGVSYTPAEVREQGDRCPVCGRKLTLGVLQRFEELSGREVETWVGDDGLTYGSTGRPPFKNLISVRQIVSEAFGVGPSTKRVERVVSSLTDRFGSELSVLLDASPSDIEAAAGDRVSDGVTRVRSGDVHIEPGYDGQYGVVRVWPDSE